MSYDIRPKSAVKLNQLSLHLLATPTGQGFGLGALGSEWPDQSVTVDNGCDYYY